MVDGRLRSGYQRGGEDSTVLERRVPPIKEIIPLQPLPVRSLLHRILPEPRGMSLQASWVHPMVLDRGQGGKQLEVACIVNHPLREYQVLHLFNTYGKFQPELEEARARRTVMENVADDWGAMTPGANITENLRIFLAEIHKNIRGLKPFLPHLIYYVNALGEERAMEYYSIPRINRKVIMPLIYFNLDKRGKIDWHDEVLSNQLNKALLEILHRQTRGGRADRKDIILDTYAGLAVLPTFYPELAADWPDDHNGHGLATAQRPAQVRANIEDFNNTHFMNNLIARLKVAV